MVLAALYMKNGSNFVAIGRNRFMWNYIFVADDIKKAASIDYFKINAVRVNEIYMQFAREVHYGTMVNAERLKLLRTLSAAKDIPGVIEDIMSDRIFTGLITRTNLDRAKMLKLVSTDLNVPLNHVQENFGSLPEQGESDIRVGNSTLYFPENARASNVETCTALVESVYKVLKSHGLGKLFNGPIRFVKDMGNTIGHYDLTNKDIKIVYSASNDKRTEFTVMHEYGHKFYYEFIPEKKGAIGETYHALLGDHRFDDSAIVKEAKQKEEELVKSLKMGSVFISTRRKYKGEWKITEILPNKIKLRSLDNPDRELSGPPSAFMNEDWAAKDSKMADRMTRLIPKKHDMGATDMWFPTEYSQKNQSEWFAELFAFYMRGNLHGEPHEFMKGLVS